METLLEPRPVRSEGHLPYLLYAPNGLADKLPLALFLHGSGERGDGEGELERVKCTVYLMC